jgi:hypothetical protein
MFKGRRFKWQWLLLAACILWAMVFGAYVPRPGELKPWTVLATSLDADGQITHAGIQFPRSALVSVTLDTQSGPIEMDVPSGLDRQEFEARLKSWLPEERERFGPAYRDAQPSEDAYVDAFNAYVREERRIHTNTLLLNLAWWLVLLAPAAALLAISVRR